MTEEEQLLEIEPHLGEYRLKREPPSRPTYCDLIAAQLQRFTRELDELALRSGQKARPAEQIMKLHFDLAQREEQLHYQQEEMVRLCAKNVLSQVIGEVEAESCRRLELELQSLRLERSQFFLRTKALQEKLRLQESSGRRKALGSSKQSLFSLENGHSSFSSSHPQDSIEEEEPRADCKLQRQIKTMLALHSLNHRRIRAWEQQFREKTGRPPVEEDREAIRIYCSLAQVYKFAVQLLQKCRTTLEQNYTSAVVPVPRKEDSFRSSRLRDQKLQSIQQLKKQLKNATSLHRAQNEKMARLLEKANAQKEAMSKELQQLERERIELVELLSQQQNQKRRVLDALDQLRGKVRVYCRISAPEKAREVVLFKEGRHVLAEGRLVQKKFQFDGVYEQGGGLALKEQLKNLLGKAVDGAAVSLLLMGEHSEDGLAGRVFQQLQMLLECRDAKISYSMCEAGDSACDLAAQKKGESVRASAFVKVCKLKELRIEYCKAAEKKSVSESPLIMAIGIQTQQKRGRLLLARLGGGQKISFRASFSESKHKIAGEFVKQFMARTFGAKASQTLKECFEGDARTTVIVSVAPHECHLEQTVALLSTAAKLRDLIGSSGRRDETRAKPEPRVLQENELAQRKFGRRSQGAKDKKSPLRRLF